MRARRMTFTTLTFVLFLGLVFAVYWSTGRRRGQNVVLILASYGFYCWWDYRFCALMLISSAVDYAAALGIGRAAGRAGRRAWLGLSLVVNLGMLGFFKYFNFFASSLRDLALSVGVELDPVSLHVVLPVGISFYTFQTLGYTIDCYRGHAQPCRAVTDYFAYVAFFPQLVAGPIERATRLLGQFAAPRAFDRDCAADGCRQILWGFAKKLLIADNLAPIVEAVYDGPTEPSGPFLVFATVCFALQIYCDFSGYTDIARGTARLFGIELMRNFAHPYFSQSVGEFWRRWHISLSTWFRDYVYIPLGGSRVGRLRRALNVMATFSLSGLWHGASWNFVVWGALNGLALLPAVVRGGQPPRLGAGDTPGGERAVPRAAVLVRMLLTFAFICLTWVFFRAGSTADAFTFLARMGRDTFDGAAWLELAEEITGQRSWRDASYFLVGLLVIEWVQRRSPHALARLPGWRSLRWAIYTLLIWSVLCYGTRSASQFIYFQF